MNVSHSQTVLWIRLQRMMHETFPFLIEARPRVPTTIKEFKDGPDPRPLLIHKKSVQHARMQSRPCH
jgi:hypothetical protein